MSYEVDFHKAFGLPSKAKCPSCEAYVPLGLDDVDLQNLPLHNPAPGVLEFPVCCKNCEETFKVRCTAHWHLEAF